MLVAQQTIEGIFAGHHCAGRDAKSSAGANPKQDGVLAPRIFEELDQLVEHDTEGGGSNAVAHAQYRTHLVHGISVATLAQIHRIAGLRHYQDIS